MGSGDCAERSQSEGMAEAVGGRVDETKPIGTGEPYMLSIPRVTHRHGTGEAGDGVSLGGLTK